MRRLLSVVLCTALMMCLPISSAWAQGIVTGSIGGTVTDGSGAIVLGAAVTATNVDTNQTFTTASNDAGAFLLDKLPPGKYRVTVTAANFSKIDIAATEVRVATVTSLGVLKLKVGATTETVDVS